MTRRHLICWGCRRRIHGRYGILPAIHALLPQERARDRLGQFTRAPARHVVPRLTPAPA